MGLFKTLILRRRVFSWNGYSLGLGCNGFGDWTGWKRVVRRVSMGILHSVNTFDRRPTPFILIFSQASSGMAQQLTG